MCSLEFENHRPLYNWVIENIFGTARKRTEFPKAAARVRPPEHDQHRHEQALSACITHVQVEMGIVDGWG